jgi:hypothetical protein
MKERGIAPSSTPGRNGRAADGAAGSAEASEGREGTSEVGLWRPPVEAPASLGGNQEAAGTDSLHHLRRGARRLKASKRQEGARWSTRAPSSAGTGASGKGGREGTARQPVQRTYTVAPRCGRVMVLPSVPWEAAGEHTGVHPTVLS